LRRNPDAVVGENQIARMNAFWGDGSWRKVAYQPPAQITLFEPVDEKVSNDKLAEGFRSRLKEQAGFEYVPKPLPMRNSRGAIVYYLFFASRKPVASKIVKDILKKYKGRV
jgi:three-Cys-motif partner protein